MSSDGASAVWKRPESVPFPSTWGVYEGRIPMANGKLPRFRIQDVTDDLIEPFVRHMATKFLPDEPVCIHVGISEDKEAVEEMSDLWREVLRSQCGLVALLENADELEDPTLPLIAGCNATFAHFPDSKDPPLKSSRLTSVLNLMNFCSHKVDVYAKYNVPVSLYAFGLSVDPIFRGQGLAVQILKARFPLCRAMGIPLTATVFTGPISQASARKAGMTLEVETLPEGYIENGKAVFAGAKTKSIHFMAAKIPD